MVLGKEEVLPKFQRGSEVKGQVGGDPRARWLWHGCPSLHCPRVIGSNGCFRKHPGLHSKSCHPTSGR